ncbi:hypothetical protein NE237_030802 [Protea cynaroides]|uniref:Uncharacterized protein n=1 Tax=Protea cynaroides TaxID=273540 RepID=A0A9Q0GUX1_9MAGN|nr:hypothetical protein NE237_030802 [Protea cynaroides]
MKEAEARINEGGGGGGTTAAEGKGKASLGVWDCGSPLYDSFELTSLSHLIERHMMILPSFGRSGRISSRFSDLSTNENRGLSEFVEQNISRRWTSVAKRTENNAKMIKKIKKIMVHAVRDLFGFRRR